MRILDSKASKEMDRIYIEEYGIPSIVLMEVAALRVLDNIKNKGESFIIMVGPGNNGGDGLAIARHLIALKKDVLVCLVQEKESKSKDYIKNLEILRSFDIKIDEYKNFDDLNKLGDKIRKYEVLIDSIFGTGLNRELSDFYKEIITIINENSKFTISIDVPSGIDSNNGESKGNIIKANETITFQVYKKGFLNYKTMDYCGKIIVESIGIPEFILDKVDCGLYLVTEEYIKNKFPKREKISHKGDFGKVLIIAGSRGFQGAAYIATESCVRSGAGLTTLATGEEVFYGLSSRLIEAMCITINKEEIKKKLKSVNTIAIGPGLGFVNTLELLRLILSEENKNIIIDADAITVLAENMELIKNNTNNKIILTPHPGEFAKISGYSIDEINSNRIDCARRFAKEFNINLVLKGYNTIIVNANKCYINTTGNSSMANGGMGDCLTGIIAALSARKIHNYDAAVLGVYIHGYIADELAKEREVVNARDIIENLPYFLRKIKNI